MKALEGLNLKKICSQYRVGLWQCPQFLFLIMGMVIITAILASYAVASQYQEPEIAALIVLILTAALFFVGYLIVKAFEQVALSSRSKSEFISIMSHQLRSPLSAIKWQLNLLLTGQTSQNEEIKGYMETIVEQNERMIRSVNDLLEVNRIEDKDVILRPSQWSLADLTHRITEDYKKYALAHNVNIVFKSFNIPKIFADEERIKSVIEHLIDNAIRYSASSGTITIEIKSKNNDKALWEITDEGRGIPIEEQKNVFEKFFRSPNTARYQTEGSGVGLFITKSIIRLSGGEVGFKSEENKGSTFWFTLPVNKTS